MVLQSPGGVIGAFYRISLHFTVNFTVLRLNLRLPGAFFLSLSLMSHTELNDEVKNRPEQVFLLRVSKIVTTGANDGLAKSLQICVSVSSSIFIKYL